MADDMTSYRVHWREERALGRWAWVSVLDRMVTASNGGGMGVGDAQG